MTKTTKTKRPPRKTRKRTARTGWSVASAAGKLLAEIENGAKIYMTTSTGVEAVITERIERICASALRQRETRVKRARGRK